MLIEVIGNSSSLLVIILISLSIYFGVQAKRKKTKWIYLIQKLCRRKKNQWLLKTEKDHSNSLFFKSSRLLPLSLSFDERGIQSQSTKNVSMTQTKILNGKTSQTKTWRTK